MNKSICLLLLLALCTRLHAQDLSLYEKKIFIRGTDTLRYRVLYPENYKKHRSYPLIMVLHGSGERGRNNEDQLLHGGDLFLKPELRAKFHAIVIFPQCPFDSAWSRFRRMPGSTEWTFVTDGNPPVPQQLAKQLIDELIETGKVNSKRVYIGGLSLGGMGTYDLLIRNPNYFAAAFPICGALNISAFISQATPLPLWIFHGALDNAVPPSFDRDLYKTLITRGAKRVLYTEYPKAGHNSWDSAFAEPQLLPWLFSAKKKNSSSW